MTMHASRRESPIFIVGLPRSGTTLLAAMIASHSRIACGPETNFFVRPPPVRARVLRQHWPESALARLRHLHLAGERVCDLFGVTDEALRVQLAGVRPSLRAVVEALPLLLARRLGKPRWAEKTPGHLQYVREIRRAFPDAVLVRMVRDPRAVSLSMTALPWASPSVAANAVECVRRYWQTERALARDRATHTIRFEDLVTAPEETLHRLCDFLGERFEPAMLTPGAAAKSLAGPGESWKWRAAEPVSAARATAWEREFPSALRPVTEDLCGELLDRWGYARRYPPPAGDALYIYGLTPSDTEKEQETLVALRAKGMAVHPVERMDRVPRRSLLLLNGAPLFTNGEGPAKKSLLAAGMLWRLLGSAEHTVWVDAGTGGSRRTKFVRCLARRCGRTVPTLGAGLTLAAEWTAHAPRNDQPPPS